MAKYLIKDLNVGDEVEIKVRCVVKSMRDHTLGLGERNGAKGLRALRLSVADGPLMGKLGTAVVEETDRLELLKRNRCSWKAFFKILFFGKKKKGK